MIWNEETINELRNLWAQGHSTSEIGRRLGVSKNAAIGKAHRLDLDGRPSPIRRGGPAPVIRAPSPPPAPRITLPPLPPVEAYVPRAAPAKPLPVCLVPEQTAMVLRFPSAGQCCWVDLGPRPMTWIQCEAMAVTGPEIRRPHSYCQQHRDASYTKRREQAA